MEMRNEDKRELSEHLDSSTSALGIPKEFQDRDHEKTKLSHEVDRILAACEYPPNLDLLIGLATSTGGLINDEVRKVACKSLVELKCPYLPTLTATEGRYCLATEATSPSSPALLARGGICRVIKMKIKSNLT